MQSTTRTHPVGAVHAFCPMPVRPIRGMKADRATVIFDAGRRSFRNDIGVDDEAHRPTRDRRWHSSR
jgi:hypothetical protein